MAFHKSPWSIQLKVISLLVSAFCAALSMGVFSIKNPFHVDPEFTPYLRALPLSVLLVAALFIVRGYTLNGEFLLIHRLFWNTKIPLLDLQSAEVMPDAMRRSIRLWGNGGFFSFTGYYRNKTLGTYRAYVTDLKRTVVIRFSKRTVVLSPEYPQTFCSEMPAGSNS